MDWWPYLLPNLAESQQISLNLIKLLPNLTMSLNLTKSHHISLNHTKSHHISLNLTKTKCRSRISCTLTGGHVCFKKKIQLCFIIKLFISSI